MNHTDQVEVVVMGGGLVGLYNAMNLAKRGVRVLLVDRFELREAPKVGESMFAFATPLLCLVADAADSMVRQRRKDSFITVSGLEGKRSFAEANEWALIHPVSEVDELNRKLNGFAYCDRQLVRSEVEEQVRRRLEGLPTASLVSDAIVEQVELGDDDHPHVVRFRSRLGETRSVRCRWVIDCTGRRRLLARQLGLAHSNGDGFQTDAVWGHFEHVRFDPAVWNEPGAESHFDRTNYTLQVWGDRYWIWVIPLSDGRLSIGVTYVQSHPPAGAGYEDRFWSVIEQYPILWDLVRDAKLTRFSSYKNVQYESTEYVSQRRFALNGDSAASIDPYYSQGLTLSFVHAWHLGNVIERDLHRGRLPVRYIDRLNRRIRADWQINREMVRCKYEHGAKDPQYLTLSQLIDTATFVAQGPQVILVRWLLERTGGSSLADSLPLRVARKVLEQIYFLSIPSPFGLVLGDAGVERLHRAAQELIAKNSRWRAAMGETRTAGAEKHFLRGRSPKWISGELLLPLAFLAPVMAWGLTSYAAARCLLDSVPRLRAAAWGRRAESHEAAGAPLVDRGERRSADDSARHRSRASA